MIAERSAFASLSSYGSRDALITREATLSHADVADRIEEHREVLTDRKRLVVLGGANTVETVVAYLAAMAHGHAVVLVPGDNPAALAGIVDAYDPDVVLDPSVGGFVERRSGTRHDLHPELSLLMSTSGSTGSPKLVRLGQDNVVSNALSIADYLRIDDSHRAITTLPMHYCYGLSVVNSHLLSGAALVMTDLSVVDACLWDLAQDARATSFAGVPYTFDLLESTDFVDRDLPSLRHVTQAGGRMAPERIGAYARLGQERGWDFYAMYGQTEATARMAYLPPQTALARPESLGVPIPGGNFTIEPDPALDEGVGELVYTGPNVMMGYATTPADLARGPELTELRTGDLARQHPDGSLEWVGRRSRIAKVAGLRIDLDRAERALDGCGLEVRCVSAGDRVTVCVDGAPDIPCLRSALATHCGLPMHLVTVDPVPEMPRTSAGKTDYAALERRARLRPDQEARIASPTSGPTLVEQIRDLYAELLERPDATPDDSFTTLRGDSLSYVEVSVRLGQLGVATPRGWHRRPIRELVPRARQTRGVSVEMTIVLRCVAILLVLGTHANLWTIPGGAHVLLAVVGYNFARFQLTDQPRLARLRGGLASVAHLALPCMVWIGGVAALLGTYHAGTVFFLNGLEGSNTWTVQWQFWFLEVIIWTQVVVLAALALPWAHRLERRAPYGFALGLLASALLLRYALTGIEAGPTERYTPSIVLWCFVLGWAVARARTRWQRIVVSLAAVVSVVGFFGDPRREAVVVAGVLLLVWAHAIVLPGWLARATAALAAASLYIYLTQWQIYPHLEDHVPTLAVLTSLAGGLAYRHAWESITRAARRTFRRSVGPGVPVRS
ncbi:AMP-dependent synthetase [Aeromicrobium sp. A1-2]|uniref:AMP-binding protein n=1 Tax=Aeromicrobium sp. A1-2 TaxID=2107713 RepID=UPI000E4C8144|nr:AMP-binding protein [Aeromicrobium sp. A1-2]AXT85597.1 AMP-dependent synthetase [Aeromicrobium sp. A1-2]